MRVSGEDQQGRLRMCWNLEWVLGLRGSLLPPALGIEAKLTLRGKRVQGDIWVPLACLCLQQSQPRDRILQGASS